MFSWAIGQPCRLVVKSCDGSPIESIQQNSFNEIIHLFKSLVTISIEPIQSNADDTELKDRNNLTVANSKCQGDYDAGTRKDKINHTAEQRKRKQVTSEFSDSSSDDCADSDTDVSEIRLNDTEDDCDYGLNENEKSDKLSNHSGETKSNHQHKNKRRKSDFIAQLSDTPKNPVKAIDDEKYSKNEDFVSVDHGSKSSSPRKTLSVVELEKETIKANVKTEKTEKKPAQTPPQPAPSPSLHKFSTTKESSKSEITEFSVADDICREFDVFEVRPKEVPPKVIVNPEIEVPCKIIKNENKQSSQDHLSLNSGPVVQRDPPPTTTTIGKCEPKKTEGPTTRRETTEKMKKSKSENTIPSNWLDVSKIPIDCVLIVTSMRNGFYQDGRVTAMAFRSIYDEFGRYKHEISGIKHEEHCIRIYTSTNFRSKIKKEIEGFNESFRLDCQLIPEVKRPLIRFEWDQEINPQNQFELIAKIKEWNKWSGSVNWVLSKWSSSRGIYRVSLTVSSKIRDTIEKENGTILLGNNRVSVIDEFDIVQCFRCADYGHLATHCNNYRRCGYCGRGHRSACKIKEPSKWKCRLCLAKGHSAFSKFCPVLLEYIRPKLEVIGYRYNYIFLANSWAG